MANIKPKGKIVTGTKKNDNIAWIAAKAWNRALLVNGGNGNDVINFRKSRYRNRLNGQNGNDTIYGGTNADVIDGGAGNDKLYGYNGNDQIYGGRGNDIIYGGNGNDRIYGQYGTNIIKGENGNDIINGGSGIDRIWGGNGNDTIFGNNGNDIIYGDAGNDHINGDYGNDIIFGGTGDDKIYGGDGDDTIYGTSGNNHIDGGNGNDTLIGGTGDDEIFGGYGNNTIYGTAGHNYICGGQGNDTIYGGTGYDEIFGYDGNDNITGGRGNDYIDGGSGSNYLYFYEGDGQDEVWNGYGNDTLIFEEGTSVYTEKDEYGFRLFVHYGNGNDQITLCGGSFNGIDVYDHSVQNIRIGNTTYPIYHFTDTQLAMARGTQQNGVNLVEYTPLFLTLENPFGGENYTYRISSSSTQTINLNFLSNGRLRIEGNNLTIRASAGQADNLIIWGNYNNIYTGDLDDIVRLGGAMDSGGPGDYLRESSHNVVMCEDGDDYIVYFGNQQYLDGNNGVVLDGYSYNENDLALSMGGSPLSSVRYAYAREEYSNIPNSADGNIGWFNQGYEGGDCRLLSFILSLSNSITTTGGSYSDYVSITQNSGSYTVTFQNYEHAGLLNAIEVTEDELAGFHYVFGDLDVVLTDLALNKLIAINQDYGHNSVMTARYNTLADYILGNENMTYANSTDDGAGYSTKISDLWNRYNNLKTINNLTITIDGENNFELGIVGNHAYTPVALTDEYISLINVWDSADILNLDLDKFYNHLNTSAFVCGYNCYGQDGLIINNAPGDHLYLADTSLNEIAQEVIGWQNGYSYTDIQPVYFNDDSAQNNYIAVASVTQDNLF
ncbi:hypothetical protein J6S88_01280 [bacterium]|nr:hypothetical protein [bacterium]